MKIAFVQDYLRVGGTERQCLALAGEAAAAGHEVLLVTFRPGGPLAGDVSPSVRLLALQPVDLHLDWFAPGLTRALREFAPEIVQLMGRMAHCHGSRILRALPKARVVATFRTGKNLPLLYRKTLKNAAAIVANSTEACRRLARDYHIEGDRVHVIRNALLTRDTAQPPRSGPELASMRRDRRRELAVSDDTIVFLCLAMLRPGKGHRALLEAASRLPSDLRWTLCLAGEGTERRPCEARARELGLGDRVRFLGMRRDTAALYAAADVAVLASQLESLPNFLVEAQWQGLPVAACDVAGVGETFLPGTSGILVPPGEPEALAAAMNQLALDPSLRSRMSAVAREHARHEFEPARQHARYLELFTSLTDTPR